MLCSVNMIFSTSAIHFCSTSSSDFIVHCNNAELFRLWYTEIVVFGAIVILSLIVCHQGIFTGTMSSVDWFACCWWHGNGRWTPSWFANMLSCLNPVLTYYAALYLCTYMSYILFEILVESSLSQCHHASLDHGLLLTYSERDLWQLS